MHEIKRAIMERLAREPHVRFSELGLSHIESNKVSYHLRELERDGVVTQEGGTYSLTLTGKSSLDYVGDASGVRKLPVAVVMVVPMKDGKILAQRRLKEPWRQWWCTIGGKVEFGEALADTARRELQEETNLSGVVTFCGLVSGRLFHEGKLNQHLHFFVFRAENLRGELVREFEKGVNEWRTLEELERSKVHPLDLFVFKNAHLSGWALEEQEFFEGEKLVHHVTDLLS